jgi:Type I phosphodiesterase / nucleotide pyrophosphatase
MRGRFATTVVMSLAIAASPFGAPSTTQSQDAGDSVMLITLDGVRTQELFGGLDIDLLRSTLRGEQKVEDTPSYRQYWATSPEERRQKLMPFFWSLVTEHGSVAGDGRVGSAVRLLNAHWFSYPGYSEILVGEPHDAEIRTNGPIRNPFPTVLETIRERLQLPTEKVATFAGWVVLNQIVEHREGATFVNAGVEAVSATHSGVRLVDALQREVTSPWDGTRVDAFTFRLAMAHLAAARPRVLYLAFTEMDDWAHDGRYERVLESLARTDGYLRELWTWLQSQPEYRGRTHLLITTDHGRGHSTKDWRDHGAKIPGSNETWMAFVSPRMSQRGQWRNHDPLTTSQAAATIASWMGIDWLADHPNAGRPVR